MFFKHAIGFSFGHEAAALRQFLGDLWPNVMIRHLPDLITVTCVHLGMRQVSPSRVSSLQNLDGPWTYLQEVVS